MLITSSKLCILIATIVLTLAGSVNVRAQETWSPVVVFDGQAISLNGAAPASQGDVPRGTPTYPGLDELYGSPTFLFPNGFAANPITHEWLVADTYNSRLLRFATDTHPGAAPGTYLGNIPTGIPGDPRVSQPYSPMVDDSGAIVVSDPMGNAVKIFAPVPGGYEGFAIRSYLEPSTNQTKTFASNEAAADGEPEAGAYGGFLYRIAFVRDEEGRMDVRAGLGALLVLEQNRHRVLKLQPDGGSLESPAWTLQMAFGRNGVGEGRFNFPTGLAVDAAGNIYVSDPNNATQVTIQVFDPSGAPLQTISEGLSFPWSLAIASDQRLFVTDTGNNRIAVFDRLRTGAAGEILEGSLASLRVRIGTPSQPLGGLSLPTGPNPPGPAGELQEPTSVAFDQQGRLLVADTDNFRMQVFDRARLTISAIAVPQTLTIETSVQVRVTVSHPGGTSPSVTNVVASVPVATFLPGSDPVISTTPLETVPSAEIDCSAPSGPTLSAGDAPLERLFTFERTGDAIGPVWFSVDAHGCVGGATVGSGSVQTYAVAVVGTSSFNAPTVSQSFAASPRNGWFNSVPVYVDLAAGLPNPAVDGDVQEIQYGFGPMPPLEGDFYTCYNVFTAFDEDGNPLPASCHIGIFKEGVTNVWYRALSSRGLYDRLTASDTDASVMVPGWNEVDVNIDLSPPYFSGLAFDGHGDHATAQNGWSNSQHSFVLEFHDTGSLLDASTLQQTFSADGPVSVPAPIVTVNDPPSKARIEFITADEGIYYVAAQASDNAGLSSVLFEGTFRIDRTPPVVDAATVSGDLVILDGNTWSKGPLTVGFHASDALSGFLGDTHETSHSLELNSHGTHVVSWTVEDLAGNAASHPPLTLGIDKRPPVVTFAAASAPAVVQSTPWYDAPVSVTFTAVDNDSGVAGSATQTASAGPGQIVRTNPAFEDRLGNVAPEVTAGPFNFDFDAPAFTAQVVKDDGSPAAPGASFDGAAWYGTPVRVRFEADDSGAGFDLAERITHKEFAPIPVPLNTLPQTITQPVEDVLHHVVSMTAGPLAVDTIGPAVSHTVISAGAGVTIGGTTWFKAPLTVRFSAADAGAGFSATSRVQTATEDVAVTGGPETVRRTFGDVLGNASEGTAGPYGVDGVAPAVAVRTSDRVVPAVNPASNPTTAVVSFDTDDVSAADNVDPAPAVTCSPASGSTFPFGRTEVKCSASDALGNVSPPRSFFVHVIDVTPPSLTVPEPISLFALADKVVPFAVSASDNLDPNPSIACTRPPAGSLFVVGTTTAVSCTATDASGNAATKTFTVTLVRNSMPVCTAAAATPGALWPPDHRLAAVGVTGVTNEDGLPVTVRITSIFQDEPTNGLGDGDTPIDGSGIGGSVARVRAERTGRGKAANGRVYTIGFTATSLAGAEASCSGIVKTGVPHDQGKGAAVDDGARYDSTR